MLTDPNPEPQRSRLSVYVILPLVVFAAGLLYVGGVFYSRWRSTQALEQKARQARREGDQRVYEMMGGDRFDILKFYAYPGVIPRGESTQLCYSVSEAKTLTLEPESHVAVWPAFSRCVGVSPKKTTTYTLTATDAAGNKKSATAAVEVR